MSWQAVKWVFKNSAARPMDRLLLLAIAEAADASGDSAWPSVDELTRKTGMSKRNVYNATKALVELGELEIDKVAMGGHPRNHYRIPIGATRAPSHGATHSPPKGATRAPSIVQEASTEGERVAPWIGATRSPLKVQHVHPEGATRSPEGATRAPGVLYTNHPEPSTNHPSGDDADSTSAQAIVGEWIDRCAKRPPANVVGQVSKQIKSMLAEAVDPDDIRRGLAAWMSKGLHPSTLPSVVNEVMNRTTQQPTPKASTTDQRVAAAQALKAKFAKPSAKELEA